MNALKVAAIIAAFGLAFLIAEALLGLVLILTHGADGAPGGGGRAA